MKNTIKLFWFIAICAIIGFSMTGCPTDSDSSSGNKKMTYKVGDTGPGGGIIFYVDKVGFTVEGYGSVGETGYFASYTAHYLEAAPTNVGSTSWASNNIMISGLSQNETDNTDWAIGRGMKNTAIIIAFGVDNGYTTNAASNCVDPYNAGGSKTDWFLPSKNELNQLYINRDYVDNMGTLRYWSSSQHSSSSGVWNQTFSDGIQQGYYEGNNANVRPIRAF